MLGYVHLQQPTTIIPKRPLLIRNVTFGTVVIFPVFFFTCVLFWHLFKVVMGVIRYDPNVLTFILELYSHFFWPRWLCGEGETSAMLEA